MSAFWEELSEGVQNKLRKAGLKSAQSILSCSRISLKGLSISADDIDTIRLKAAESFRLKFSSVNELLLTESSKWQHLSFACKTLDSPLNGGICTRGITEIFGESGVGKTQILLQLSLSVQLPIAYGGLSKGAVFICTEDVFPSKRLYQLIEVFQSKFNEKLDYVQNIFVEHIIEMDDLLGCVSTRLPQLMAAKSIGLVIIDSTAGVFRVESNIIPRAYAMRKLAKNLLFLANKHNCAVVCANQVSVNPTAQPICNLAPCLGLAWANLIRVRLYISKTHKQIAETIGTSTYSTVVRRMEVIFSPDVKRDGGCFSILREHGIGEQVYIKEVTPS